MKILCNNYCPDVEEQPGDQPIRVFYGFYCNIYQNIKSELIKEYPQAGLESNRFDFYTNNIAAVSPECSVKQISIHDTFLSFLWSYIYGITLMMPMGGKSLSLADRFLAEESIKYSLSLLNQYNEWDKEAFPNPELHEEDLFQYAGKTNNMFIIGINHIFYHEFAHIVLGHIKELETNSKLSKTTSKERRKSMEFEADNFATDRVLNLCENESDLYNARTGVVFSMSALAFTSNNFSGGKVHPDPDHRIKMCLERMNIPPNDISWGYASFALMQWIIYNKKFKLPSEFKLQRDYFYEILEGIDSLKNNA